MHFKNFARTRVSNKMEKNSLMTRSLTQTSKQQGDAGKSGANLWISNRHSSSVFLIMGVHTTRTSLGIWSYHIFPRCCLCNIYSTATNTVTWISMWSDKISSSLINFPTCAHCCYATIAPERTTKAIAPLSNSPARTYTHRKLCAVFKPMHPINTLSGLPDML